MPRSSHDAVPEHSIYARTNSLNLIFCGLAWVGYLFAQCGALALGLNSIHGCLIRLCAATLFLAGTVFFFLGLRRRAPYSTLVQLSLNALAVAFYILAILHLLEIQPNIPEFVRFYHQAQVLICIAWFFIAYCLRQDPRFPRWLPPIIVGYAALLAVQNVMHHIGVNMQPYDPPAVALTIICELTFAFAIIKVGSQQLIKQEAELRGS